MSKQHLCCAAGVHSVCAVIKGGTIILRLGDLQIIVDDRGHCAYASMRDPSDIAQLTTGTLVLDTRHYLTVPEARIPKILFSRCKAAESSTANWTDGREGLCSH
jgi:hypothetical protein